MDRRLSRVLWPVIAGLAIFISLGAWAIASPVGASPDDDFHLASIWCGQGEREGLCEEGSDPSSKWVPTKATSAACYAFEREVTPKCQGSDFLASGFELTETTRLNAGDQYPPAYYFITSFFAGDNVAVSTIAVRLFNAAIFSILAVGTWCLLPGRFRFTLAGSIALTFIPLGVFITASVNPSSWALMSGAFLLPALLGYFASLGWRRALLGAISVLSAFLAFGSRGDSAAFTIVAVLAAGVLSFRASRRYWASLALPTVIIICGAVAFLSAGQTGLAISGQMTVDSDPNNPDLPEKPVLILLNLLSIPDLWTGIFGHEFGLGWLDTPVPALVPAAGVFLFAGVLFASLNWISVRRAIALTGIGLAAVFVPVYVLVQAGAFVGSDVQPRYILPLITMFLAAAIAPSSDTHELATTGLRLSPVQLWLIAIGLCAAQALALFSNLHRYVTTGSYNLDGAIDWWWTTGPSPFTVLYLGSISFAGVMILFVLGSIRSMANPNVPIARPAVAQAIGAGSNSHTSQVASLGSRSGDGSDLGNHRTE